MKKLFFLTAVLSVGTLFAQKPIKADADRITVYFDGALVEKSAKISLRAGDNSFMLKANSPFLQRNSIQFEADDNFMITDFTPVFATSEDYYSYEETLPSQEKRRYLQLKDSIKHLNKCLREAETYKTILQKQTVALNSMKAISQSQTIDSLPKIKETVDYYRAKMMEITKEEIATDEKIKLYTDLLAKQRHLLSVFQMDYPEKKTAETSKKEYYIKINIYAERDIPSVNLKYSYICDNVQWYPSYDAKLYSDKDDMRFVLKANLINNSNEDWKDVTLTFSCESVNNNHLMEQTYPYYISNIAVKPVAARRSKMMARNEVADQVSFEAAEEVAGAGFDESPRLSNYTALTTSANSLLGKEYTVGRKHNIASENTTKTIALQTNDTKVNYDYIIRPKNAKRAYLVASIPSWQGAELVDADANVYFDNKYSTQAYISPSTTQSDTMQLQLGTDKRINVNRKVSKSTPSKTSLMGKELETTVEINIQIKNNNLKDIEAEIEDRLPISKDPEIKIQVLDLQSAKYEEDSGRLQWKLRMQAGEMKTLKVKYSVRYPKDYTLNLE